MSLLIGREAETKLLQEALKNNKSELIALYGRRRIGKTFLIRQFFKKQIVFEITGLFRAPMTDQLNNFIREIPQKKRKYQQAPPKTWLDAFALLRNHLDSLKGNNKKVIFIDEFPWIATAKSKFLTAFENFWNNYCTKRNDLIVVICGSAASYMVQKIINNKGGLHNRITRKIRLLPFNIQETNLFLKNKGIKYTEYDTIQLYMILGGVPHYLEKINRGLSVTQNIDALCFQKEGLLYDEFNQLYASLFDDSERHRAIIKALATVNKAMTRNELATKSGIPSGGDFTLKLNELIESGFVSEHPYYQNKKQLTSYRLSDEYSKFYLKFIHPNRNSGKGTWQRLSIKPSYVSWRGFAFENLCLKHISQIKKVLGIEAVYSINSCWLSKNAQIDLLIDRDDNVINICEIKFVDSMFTIDKTYYQNLKNKLIEFKKTTKTRKNIYLTMITSYGLNQNKYSNELIDADFDMNCLFIS
jgi:AAA+ ATPase superfamily predicted ATPase